MVGLKDVYERIARQWEALERVNERFLKVYDWIDSIMFRLKEIEDELDKMKKGFTLVEVIVTVAVLGILAVGISTALNTIQESRMVACTADLHAMEDMTQQYYMQTMPWTPERAGLYQWMGTHLKEHYHYIPNNNDRNKGHGNDLDLCDEENPGKSLDNRDCLDIQWVWVCDHNHGSLAKYNFSISRGEVYAVSKDGEKPFLHDLRWWDKKDPNLRRWIGR